MGVTVNHDTTIIQCANCGTKNRIPKNRLQDKPICGKCRRPLIVGVVYESPVIVKDSTFSMEVLSYPGAVIVDCWAPWCGPCRMVSPILDQLASEYAGRVKIAKLNVDENPLTASQYSIRGIPTMLLFRDGKLVNSLVGALPRGEIEGHLRSIL
jgi:thioredoxin 2